MYDATAHAIRTPQQARGALKMSLTESLAHGGAAHADAVSDERRNLLHLEAMPAAGRGQRFDRTEALTAEAEVVADDHMPRAESGDDQVGDELLGTHCAHALVEAQGHQTIDTQGRQGDELFAPARQPGRGPFGVEELLGARLEHEHGGRTPGFGSAAFERCDHLLMAQMDAVKIADSEHATPMFLRNIV
jgi:hypothetical protein